MKLKYGIITLMATFLFTLTAQAHIRSRKGRQCNKKDKDEANSRECLGSYCQR